MTPPRLQGLGVSPGVALGRVHLIRPPWLPVVAEPIPPERVEEEIDRFHAALADAGQAILELKGTVERELGEAYAAILEVQRLILEDRRLVEDTLARIRVGRVSASWALKENVGVLMRRFAAVDDPYIRERGGELADVHRRLQRLLRGEGARAPSDLPEGPVVVVAPNLGPGDAILLARRGVSGLATDGGGQTSHTAILAQALSVPAVAGLHDITSRVRNGDRIVLDGDTGQVNLLPTEAETERAEDRRRAWLAREDAMAAAREARSITRDGVEIVLRANIEFAEEVETALRFGAAGVGLYRSEFLFLAHAPELPGEEAHYATYREIAERMAPHPVVLRTLDLGGEKYFHDVLDETEPNPVLGLRGIRLCLRRPDIFRPQLRGLLRAATGGNLQVMLPMVVSVDEIREVRRLLAGEAETLKSEGIEARADVPLGIMIEVPAAAMSADLLACEADFFSLGTNDLVQYALAVDRGNDQVADLYQPAHPGLLRMFRFVARAARERGIPVAVCGESGADPEMVPTLIGLGLREFSMPPRAIAAVREAVRQVDAGAEARRIDAELEATRERLPEPDGVR